MEHGSVAPVLAQLLSAAHERRAIEALRSLSEANQGTPTLLNRPPNPPELRKPPREHREVQEQRSSRGRAGEDLDRGGLEAARSLVRGEVMDGAFEGVGQVS